MIHAGEDPRFIARRIVICAAEDVGLADPMALVLANTALQCSEFVGWPEHGYRWRKATVYIATANKSNSALPWQLTPRWKTCVPAARCPCRNICATRITKAPNGWATARVNEYAHDHLEHFVAQDYSGAEKCYYKPTEAGSGKEDQGAGRKMAKTNTILEEENLIEFFFALDNSFAAQLHLRP